MKMSLVAMLVYGPVALKFLIRSVGNLRVYSAFFPPNLIFWHLNITSFPHDETNLSYT